MSTVGKIMTSVVAGTVAGVVARKWLRKSKNSTTGSVAKDIVFDEQKYDRSERSKDAGMHYFVG
ncbi:MAG: hypothetical protein SFY32_12935 [Bacteroidota bacterium]|nr:hypothetical protein [Bacteroidota bacterium]